MKVVSEKLVLAPEVLDLLEKRKKEGELGYEQQNTLEYLQSFSKLSEKDAKALFKELIEAGLNEKQAVAVCNILPKKEDTLKTILTADKSDLPEEKVKEVLKIVKKY